MKKRNDGRNEPIVDPEIPIIDAHHHLIDRQGVRYLLAEIVKDVSSGHDVRATVYIESHSMMRQEGPQMLRPVGETEFANGMAAMSASGNYGPCRINSAIVSFADLAAGDAVAQTLDAHMAVAPDRFRGIRQVAIWHPSEEPYRFMAARPAKGILTSEKFRSGFAKLAERKLTFDTAIFHTQLGDLTDVADNFPDTSIILNHMGFAMALGADEAGRAEVFRAWSEGLRDLARRANVTVKIGGLGMPFWGFRFEERPDEISSEELAKAWRPYVETAIEIFGPDRCMLESNFPADGNSCGYVPTWNALKTLVRPYSADEKKSLFWTTAAKVYGLKVD